MRNKFDKVAKGIGEEALGTSGTISINAEVSPETQHADLRHEPDPQRKAERKRLGLLGRLAAVPCLIEVFSQSLSANDFRACLLCRTRHNRHYAAWRIMPRRTVLSTKMAVGDAA